MPKFGYSFDPIVPEPDWGITSPNVEPDEWVEDDDDDFED